MAYQSKNHRKFLATSLTAAMVASAVAPAAGFAAEATKTFPDVPASHWAKDAIDYLVGKGALEGRPNGTFDPTAEITRGEAAKILSITLGLEVSDDATASFGDLKGHWASKYVAAIEGQTEDVINGYQDGTFKPNNKITRQEMAKMIVTAYGLEANEDVTVDFSDNNSWGAEYVNTLASLGIVEGMSAGKFAPQASVTRAQTPVFVHRAEVEEVRVTPDQDVELAITNVSALTEDGHVLKVEFSKSIKSIDKAEVSLYETASKARVGIEKIVLASDGKSAEIFAYDNTDNNAPYEVKRGVEYSLTIGKLTTEFTRPYYLDERSNARVTEIDAADKDFVVSYGEGDSETISVPEGVEFDYEAAVGMEIRVWFNGENELVNYEIADASKVAYDAFEVSKAVDKSEGKGQIELITADKKYDLATDKDNEVSTVYYLDGEKVEDIEDLADAKYAKVILDKKGDVAYIYAYDLEGLTVVESVDGNIVEGLGDEDLDLEDFVIVKDGKTIQISDLEKGDAIYYAEGASNSLGEEGYAVVYNNIITGEIETIYDDSFVVDGKKYSYDTISFLNEDDEIVSSFTKDDAEDFESEEVSIYVDYNGDIQLLTGVQVDAGNEVGALLTADGLVWDDNKGKLSVELEYVTEEGEEKLVDVSFDKLDSITVDGDKYKIEQDKNKDKNFIVKSHATKDNTFTINVNGSGATDSEVKETVELTDNTSFILTLDDKGNVTDLEFFNGNMSGDLEEDIEPGDKYAKLDSGDKRLQNNTIVFVAEDGKDTDADDIKAYKFADIDFDIDADTAEVYYNKKGDVELIVVEDTVASNTTDVIAVVDSYSTTDDEVTRLVAYVNGKKTTYTVDKVELGTSEELKALLADGQAVKLKINDESGVVEEIFVYGDDKLTGDYFLLNQKDATGITSSKFTLGTTEYQKGDNFQIIDATKRNDLDTEASLSSIKGKKFHVVLEAKGSRYVDTIVIIGDEGAPNDDRYLDETDPVVSVNDGTDALQDGDVFANGDTLKITVSAGSDTVDSVTLSKGGAPATDIRIAATGAGHTIATDNTEDGSYELTYIASDAAGNTVTDTITFEVDGTVPATPTEDGTDDKEGKTVTADFDIIVDAETDAKVTAALDGENVLKSVADVTATADKATLPIDYSKLASGSNAIVITVTDAAGNVSATLTVNVTK